MNNIFKVGFGRENITPPLGTLLYGYPNLRPAKSVHDELMVSAFAFEQGKDRAIIISADICEIDEEGSSIIRKQVCEATGVPFENIIFSTIHTHSGPCTMDSPGWGDNDSFYTEKILHPMAVKASVNAVSNMRNAVMGVGVVESEAGVNRRERSLDGEVILGQNPWGVFDKKMTVISFRDTEGYGIGCMINYGAHCTSAGQGSEITRDWAGGMCDALEKECGMPVTFVSGPTGDTGPRLSNGQTTGDIKETEALGIKAGADAIKAYRSISNYKTPDLTIYTDTVSLPFKPLISYEEAKNSLEKLGDVSGLVGRPQKAAAKFRAVMELYENNVPIKKSLDYSVTVISVGDVAFLPFPFEVFCEISLRISQKSPFAYTLVVNNANGSFTYLPTKSEIPLGGYEVFIFDHFLTYDLLPDTDTMAVKEYVRILDELKDKVK